MTKEDSSTIGSILFLGTVLAGLWLFDWFPFRAEITTYEATCVAYTEQGLCSPKNVRAGPTVHYQAEKESRTVVFWADGEAPAKYDNCAIVDVENWSCHDTSEAHQMVNGRFDEVTPNDWYPHQVSKARWWWLRFLHM